MRQENRWLAGGFFILDPPIIVVDSVQLIEMLAEIAAENDLRDRTLPSPAACTDGAA